MKGSRSALPASYFAHRLRRAGCGTALLVVLLVAATCATPGVDAVSSGSGTPEVHPNVATTPFSHVSAQGSATALAPGLDDYRSVTEPGVAHRLWVLVPEAGELELRDAKMRLLASERSMHPVLNNTFIPAEGVFEQVFFLRFEGEEGATRTQRILRVRPDRDTYRILRRSAQARDGWLLVDVEPDEFERTAMALAADRDLAAGGTFEDLDAELAALLELDAADALEPGAPLHTDTDAHRLREEGLERLGRGDYAGALERLEESLGLLPDAELADRVARLRAYLQLRGL